MEIKHDVPLGSYTTMQVGGPASFFVEISSPEELREAVSFARQRNLPMFALGGGSNIVMSDRGFPGLVLKMELRGIQFTSSGDSVRAVACAGEVWDDFVSETVRRNLHGLENLSLIPGSVGAAPIQNIGAYGADVSHTIEWVEAFDTDVLQSRTFSKNDCHFRYRDSYFKRTPAIIVTRVAFLLKRGGKTKIDYRDLKDYFTRLQETHPSIQAVRDAVIAIRRAKLPDPAEISNTGSFFKNPVIPKEQLEVLKRTYKDIPSYEVDAATVKIPLAWILDRVCGLKGARSGSVGLHDTQALVLVNHGGASADEIRNFAESVRTTVYAKTGIMPEYEVSFIGAFER